MSAAVADTRIGLLSLESPEPGWHEEALATIRAFEKHDGPRIVVLRVDGPFAGEMAYARTIVREIARSNRLYVGVFDGAYSAVGLTLLAGVDLAIASESSTFGLEAADYAAFDETWIATLSIRDAKWLAFGAGHLDATWLAERGTVNFLAPAGEADRVGGEIAAHAARIASDVIGLKKRAHDTRHRLPAV